MSHARSNAAAAPAGLPRGAPAAARIVAALLAQLPHGRLDLRWPDGRQQRYGAADAQPQAVLELTDWDVCAQALKTGDIGFAEAYIAGRARTPDLAALLHLFVANRDALEQAIYGNRLAGLLYRIKHLLRPNTRRGSRRNIHAHYDIGNDFYRLWLDDSMSYSSALFDTHRPDGDLHAAQRTKMRRALGACGVAPGGRLLEIGCGWGALAQCAAEEFGARVTGITLSTEQLALARERIAGAGLDAQVDLRLQDYRDVDDGPYDAIVSIEMFEAVGRAYWRAYFDALHRLLRPGARACVQSITIRDDLFERYVRGSDFIQQYIFPGGLLPSRAQFRQAAARAGLVVQDEHAFGASYAETLRRWRAAFLGQEVALRRLGFDTRFVRTWEFYLAYCEAAFDGGNTDVVQFTLRRA
jgi:cyclopropane-fatty-acyl-phospholipid synthase